MNETLATAAMPHTKDASSWANQLPDPEVAAIADQQPQGAAGDEKDAGPPVPTRGPDSGEIFFATKSPAP